MPSNQFEDKIRQKFEHAKVAPSPEVWGQLSNRLQKEDRRGFILPLFKWGSLITVAAAACLGMWLMTKPSLPPSQDSTPMVTDNSFEPEITTPKSSSESLSLAQEPESKVLQPTSPELISAVAKQASSPSLTPRVRASSLVLTPPGAKIKSFEKPFSTLWPSRQQAPFYWEGLPNVKSDDRYLSLDQQGKYPVKHLEPATKSTFRGLASVHNTHETHLRPPVADLPRQILISGQDQRKSRGGPKLSYGLTAMSLFQLKTLSTTYVDNSARNAVSVPPVGLDVRQVTTDFHYPDVLAGLALKLEYLLGPVFSLETGLGVIKGKTSNSRIPFENLDNTFVNLSALPGNSSNQLDYTSLSVPLLVNMRLGKKRHKLKVSLGVLSQWLAAREQSQQIIESFTVLNNTSAATEFNTLNIQGQTSLLPRTMWNILTRLQYEYFISDRVAIGAGPTLSYGLQPSYTYGIQNGDAPLAAGFELNVSFFPKM